MRVSGDKDLNRIVDHFVNEHGWSVMRGAKHFIAVAPNGRKLPIQGSPSPRGAVSWRAQARRLMAA